jgi:hypothetical protein
LTGHRVTIQTRDDRRRLARNVHEDRRGRSAVHRAVVDPGQHDDGGDRGSRERTELARGRRRSSPAAHDQGSDEDADKTVEEVDRLSATWKPPRTPWKIPRSNPKGPVGSWVFSQIGTARDANARAPAETALNAQLAAPDERGARKGTSRYEPERLQQRRCFRGARRPRRGAADSGRIRRRGGLSRTSRRSARPRGGPAPRRPRTKESGPGATEATELERDSLNSGEDRDGQPEEPADQVARHGRLLHQPGFLASSSTVRYPPGSR